MTMVLEIDSADEIIVDDATDFQALLETVNGRSSNFAILSKADQHYIQTHCDGGEYILEKREGHQDAHYAATKNTRAQVVSQRIKWWQFWKRQGERETFSLDIIVDQFSSYASGKQPETQVSWTKMELV